jgi:hypothetical protein
LLARRALNPAEKPDAQARDDSSTQPLLARRALNPEPDAQARDDSETQPLLARRALNPAPEPDAEPNAPLPGKARSRRGWLFIGALLALVALIVGFRSLLLSRGPELVSSPVSIPSVTPQDTKLVREPDEPLIGDTNFADPISAINNAKEGAVVTLPPGRWSIAGLHAKQKKLTLRANKPGEVIFDRSDARTWDAMLGSSGELILEGITLIAVASDRPQAPLIQIEKGSLTLRDCRLEQYQRAAVVALRLGASLSVERCHIEAATQGLAIETGPEPCRVSVQQSAIEIRHPSGPALLLWQPEEATTSAVLNVDLQAARITAGRILVCRSVHRPVECRVEGSRLTFRESLVSFDNYTEREAWTKVLRMGERENAYEPGTAWLRAEGESIIPNQEQWNKLWRR